MYQGKKRRISFGKMTCRSHPVSRFRERCSDHLNLTTGIRIKSKHLEKIILALVRRGKPVVKHLSTGVQGRTYYIIKIKYPARVKRWNYAYVVVIRETHGSYVTTVLTRAYFLAWLKRHRKRRPKPTNPSKPR